MKLRHESGAQVLVHAGRGEAGLPHPDFEPTVAWAAADSVATALEALIEALPNFVRVVDDYGLTTGICFTTRLPYWRRFDRPRPKRPVPVRVRAQVQGMRAQVGQAAARCFLNARQDVGAPPGASRLAR